MKGEELMNAGVKNEEVVLSGVHCPYCNTDDAVLISRTTKKKISLQQPEYGLKYLLCWLFAPFYAFIHGFKLIEAKRTIETQSFVFCPHCGNSYEIAPQEGMGAPAAEEKFRRIRAGKKISGVCTGISEYTGISLKWIRFVSVLYCLIGLGLVAYVLMAIFIPFKEDDR